jgi:hypothetical protein
MKKCNLKSFLKRKLTKVVVEGRMVLKLPREGDHVDRELTKVTVGGKRVSTGLVPGRRRDGRVLVVRCTVPLQ